MPSSAPATWSLKIFSIHTICFNRWIRKHKILILLDLEKGRLCYWIVLLSTFLFPVFDPRSEYSRVGWLFQSRRINSKVFELVVKANMQNIVSSKSLRKPNCNFKKATHFMSSSPNNALGPVAVTFSMWLLRIRLSVTLALV